MNSYQLTLLIDSKLDEKACRELLDSLAKKMDKVEKEDLWGSRSLAYQIKHQDKANYVHLEFAADPKEISSLDKMLKLNEDILRYLLLRKD